MTDTTHPTKEDVRKYMESRAATDEAPPTPEEIRQQLGWYMIPANRRPDYRDEP